jgi:hypothetical protein
VKNTEKEDLRVIVGVEVKNHALKNEGKPSNQK